MTQTAWESKSLYERAMAIQSQMEKDRSVFDAQRDVIVEFLRPDITDDTETSGAFQGSTIYEGTGPWAAQTWARGFQGSMVGPSITWRRYFLREPANRRANVFKGNDDVNAWLQDCNDHMSWTNRNSNYYSVMPEFVLDGGTIGSPCMIIEEDLATGKQECKVPHYTENYYQRNWFGHDVRYHRKYRLSNLAAADYYGKENLPLNTKNALDNGQHDATQEYLCVFWKVSDDALRNLPEGTKYRKRNGRIRWVCLHFAYAAGTQDEKQPIMQRAYEYQPFHAWHYKRLGHESYGRTPGWWSIYDVRGHNQAWSDVFDMVEGEADPALIMLAEMRARVDSAAGGETYVSPEEYDRPPRRLIESGRGYERVMDFLQRLGMSVERHFHIELFKMLDRFARDHKGTPPTAYQIAQMQAENQLQVGPAVESYERGLLEPVDGRMVDIEIRAGRFPMPPQIVLDYLDSDLIPQFTGPLAIAQTAYETMRRTASGFAAAEPVFNLFPEAKHKIKPEVLVEHILEDSDFYQDAIRDDQEYQEIIQALQQAENERNMLENAQRMGSASQGLGKPVDETSPLAALRESA